MTQIVQRSAVQRLLLLAVLSALLLFFLPSMARGKHIPHYQGQLLCGSVASAVIVLSLRVFARGGLWQRVLAGLLLLLPAFVMWDIFKYGLPWK
jgi:glucan phosphoethanolaminetransferase (alkaline phosphatase superfamily)